VIRKIAEFTRDDGRGEARRDEEGERSRASQRAIKYRSSARRLAAPIVIRVSFFRFLPFLLRSAQSGQAPGRARLLLTASPRLNSFIRTPPFSTHRQAQTAAVSGPTFNFRLTSLSSSRCTICRFDVRNDHGTASNCRRASERAILRGERKVNLFRA